MSEHSEERQRALEEIRKNATTLNSAMSAEGFEEALKVLLVSLAEAERTSVVRVRTRYVPATGSAGAKIQATYASDTQTTRRTYPYDYGARDAHLAAAVRVLAELEPTADPESLRVVSWPNRGYVIEVQDG